MLELSEIIYQYLTTNIPVFEVVENKVFPMIADQETDFPFVVYRVQQLETKTKDRSTEYLVTILSFESTYNLALALNKKVQDAMISVSNNNKEYRFVSTSATPFLTEDNKFYIEQKFNILK